ncbi:unnamed protein product [Haemonchus placei]|uniref:Uncharacterized protein n=1 Tax=Haemonchus placei TaxID=6290 RepID=A0A0N4WJY8_HAEPC|nr:unnamed protein product [Haemonchus placei]
MGEAPIDANDDDLMGMLRQRPTQGHSCRTIATPVASSQTERSEICRQINPTDGGGLELSEVRMMPQTARLSASQLAHRCLYRNSHLMNNAPAERE